MRSCVKNAPQAPINVNLSSSQQQAAFSKGLREHSSPYFSSPRSFFFLKATAAPWAFLDKGPVSPRRLDQAHPADVVISTPLASSHRAVLVSPQLNELRWLQ